MPITAEQFSMTLENMAKAWAEIASEHRLPKDEDKSFFDGSKDMLNTCKEMIQRWHSGQSSHADSQDLAAMYADTDEGAKQLQDDLFKLRDDAFVQAADLNLRLIKYTAPSE
mmetsp:Transcript_12794/g.40143  ORF Transcript_12794/g.40143 Transcript_12794/m.40143 type:complete len:112 (-) Transcript_12794:132-467(-)